MQSKLIESNLPQSQQPICSNLQIRTTLEFIMKFGKNLAQVIEFSDPEWGPYWMNYKFLKKKINDIVHEHGGTKISDPSQCTNPLVLSKSISEVEFFRLLKSELKKTNDFFKTEEGLFKIRKTRVWDGFNLLKGHSQISDKSTWTRLSMACVKFYEDVLLLENFAIMNYCGFSKILKKHDKMTGFSTREAFMKNTMEHQSFTHHEAVIQMLKESEELFLNIQSMKSAMPLKEEERMFIEAIRDLNYQASRLRAEENDTLRRTSGGGGGGENEVIKEGGDTVSEEDGDDNNSNNNNNGIDNETTTITIASKLFPHASSSNNNNTTSARTSTSNSSNSSNSTTPFQSASDGLQAATDALTAVAKRTYLSQSLPNLSSAISWIHNLSTENSNSNSRSPLTSESNNNNNINNIHTLRTYSEGGGNDEIEASSNATSSNDNSGNTIGSNSGSKRRSLSESLDTHVKRSKP